MRFCGSLKREIEEIEVQDSRLPACFLYPLLLYMNLMFLSIPVELIAVTMAQAAKGVRFVAEYIEYTIDCECIPDEIDQLYINMSHIPLCIQTRNTVYCCVCLIGN